MAKNKKLRIPFLLLLAFCAGSAHAQSDDPPKIGFVNAVRIVEEAPQGKASLNQLESEFFDRREQLRAQAKELQNLEDKLANDSGSMSESARTALEQEIRKSQRRLEREQDEFREDLNFRRNQEIEKLQILVHKLIASIGQREKFDLIVQEPVVWVSNRIDLTEQVLKELEEEFKKGQ